MSEHSKHPKSQLVSGRYPVPPSRERPGQLVMSKHLVSLGYSARIVVEAFDLAPLLSAELVQFEIDVQQGLTRFNPDPRSLDHLAGTGDS